MMIFRSWSGRRPLGLMVLLATRKTVQYTGIIPPNRRYLFR
jgi:hypothetical protein